MSSSYTKMQSKPLHTESISLLNVFSTFLRRNGVQKVLWWLFLICSPVSLIFGGCPVRDLPSKINACQLIQLKNHVCTALDSGPGLQPRWRRHQTSGLRRGEITTDYDPLMFAPRDSIASKTALAMVNFSGAGLGVHMHEIEVPIWQRNDFCYIKQLFPS